MEINVNETVIKKGYEFLRELCAFNADFNAFKKGCVDPVTNRVQYIMNRLEKNNIPYTLDKFLARQNTPDFVEGQKAFVNVVVEIEGENKDITTVFLAHHDVANIESENCQDNTASVANLLDLCVRLSENKPANNVVIAFVDAEEIVNPSICGAQRLAQNILNGKYGNVQYAVNLELTANGQNYWMSYHNPNNQLATRIGELHPNVMRVSTPYNDAFVMEGKGIQSVCVGSVNNENIEQLKTYKFCQTWAMCHSVRDTFDSQAVETDMTLFVDFLETLI